jgi:hypothetical protein
MRQGGMKPKGHSSGTYWVRANAKTGGSKKKKNLNQSKELEGDYNHDGIVDKWDTIDRNVIIWARLGGVFIAVIIVIVALIF